MRNEKRYLIVVSYLAVGAVGFTIGIVIMDYKRDKDVAFWNKMFDSSVHTNVELEKTNESLRSYVDHWERIAEFRKSEIDKRTEKDRSDAEYRRIIDQIDSKYKRDHKPDYNAKPAYNVQNYDVMGPITE